MASMRKRRRRWRTSKAVRRRILRQVQAILAGISQGGQLQFLHTPKGSLGGTTPMQAILSGRARAVVVAATGFVER
jgi:hypothetical protein